jgi:hypothetical protein
MKVSELIEVLQGLDPEREVILQRDPEGNGFSPFGDWYEALYRAESTWSGEVLHPLDVEEGSMTKRPLRQLRKSWCSGR